MRMGAGDGPLPPRVGRKRLLPQALVIFIQIYTIICCRINMIFEGFSGSECDPWIRTTNGCKYSRGHGGKTWIYTILRYRINKAFQVRNATPGPGPQTAANIAAATVKKASHDQDGKTKKPTKSAKAPPKITKAEVTWTLGSFMTHAKDLHS